MEIKEEDALQTFLLEVINNMEILLNGSIVF